MGSASPHWLLLRIQVWAIRFFLSQSLRALCSLPLINKYRVRVHVHSGDLQVIVQVQNIQQPDRPQTGPVVGFIRARTVGDGFQFSANRGARLSSERVRSGLEHPLTGHADVERIGPTSNLLHKFNVTEEPV